MPCLPAALDWHLPCNNSWSAGQAAHLRICSATHLFIRSAAHPSPPPPLAPPADTYYPVNTVQCCTPALLLENGDAWELERCGCGDSTDPDFPVSCGGANTHELLLGYPYFRCGGVWGGAGRGGGWVAGLLGFSVSAFATACAVGISPHPLSSPPTPPHPPTCPQAVPAGPCGACWPRAVLPRLPVGYRAPHG